MRELDTESPVVWPAWCYTGEVSSETSGNSTAAAATRGDRGEAADLATTTATTTHAEDAHPRNRGGSINLTINTVATLDARGSTSPQGASTTHLAATTPRPPRGRRRPAQNHNGLDAPQVKTERLTPDNNSTSSRSVTPCSSSGHPGTPPNATSLVQGAPGDGIVAPTPVGGAPHHLKHMEQMMGRNYSDFMRSLAAKYNNSNPNDYFSSSRNGYPAGLDPRFAGSFKPTAPYVGLMAPLCANSSGPQAAPAQQLTAAGAGKEPKEPKLPVDPSSGAATAGGGLFGSPAAATGLFPPMLDMSSTQALLHMVRTANAAQSAAELESYLKGANKREVGLSSPLDLSSPSFAPRNKRSRHQRGDSVSPKPSKIPALGVTSLTSPSAPSTPIPQPAAVLQAPASALQQQPAMLQATTTTTQQQTTMTTTTADGSPPPVRCPSLCGHMPCGDGQAVNGWSVEDVVNYVSTIDICAEYAQNFREHRIDGATLPLLSEEHLTGPIGMKLGPAIKLRVLLARKLGACTVCLHCAHCHQTPLPSALSAAAAVAAAAAAAQQHAHQAHQSTSTTTAAASRRPSANNSN